MTAFIALVCIASWVLGFSAVLARLTSALGDPHPDRCPGRCTKCESAIGLSLIWPLSLPLLLLKRKL